jgi:glycerophosphoryl diester phosphodiesterase
LGDPLLLSLLNTSQAESERALAARYAPIIRFDTREPFLPLAAGYSIFRQSAPSPSFRPGHVVEVAPPACLAIEYAIWWDWDIGHLYELEHVWVFVDEGGHVVRCDASWHGGYHAVPLALQGEHVTLYSEPGKHAFAPTPDWFKERRKKFKRTETNDLAGIGGVLMARHLEGKVTPTPLKTRLAHTYLSRQAFEPSWDFAQVFPLLAPMLVPWPALCAWMPGRVNHILDQLAREIAPADYRCLRIGCCGAAALDNTLPGLRRAALGADLVALNVRQTAEGQLVLSPDGYLTDTQGRVHLIGRSTLADLQAVDPGQGERIPTLAQAIELCQQESLGAYIEFKEGRCVPAVMVLIRDKHFSEDCIGAAFRPDWIAEARVLAPKVLTSILFRSSQVDPVPLAQSAGANFVQPRWERLERPSALLTPDWIARVRQAGLGLIGWPEERPDEIAALRRAGVDGVCRAAPEGLR